MLKYLTLISFYLLSINCISSTQKISEDSVYDSFGVVYSAINPRAVSDYSVLIVEPYFYSNQDIIDLQTRGIKVLAYLSLGEVNESRRYFNDLKEIGLKGKNENHGSYYIDISNREVKEKFLNQIVPQLLSLGYDGLFLDTIDAVAPYTIRRDMEEDMVELIQGIRNNNPDKVLIQNAGFFLLDQTSEYVNAVAIEGVASGYDFKENEYLLKSEKEFEERLNFIGSMYGNYGIPFLIIDFAESFEKSLIVKERLTKTGYPFFISNIGFNGLPNWSKKSPKLKKGA